MAKLVLVCGVRLAAGAWQLCEERREFGTGTSLRAASTRGRAQCPAPRHGRPRGGRPSPLGHPLYTEPARDKVGPLEPDKHVSQPRRPIPRHAASLVNFFSLLSMYHHAIRVAAR